MSAVRPSSQPSKKSRSKKSGSLAPRGRIARFYDWLGFLWFCWTEIRKQIDFRAWLPAVPAVIAILAVASLTIANTLVAHAEHHDRYLTQARRSFVAGDYQTALTCYQRVIQLRRQVPQTYYEMALTHEALGDTEAAQFFMAELAPLENDGHAPAHWWQAKKLLESKDNPAANLSAIETHLRRALAGQIENRERIHAILGQICLSSARYDDAEMHLSQAVKAMPELRLQLARVYALKGNTERAQAEAAEALEFQRDVVRKDGRKHNARLAWADAATFLEDFETANTILEEGYQLTREPIYLAALGKMHSVWFDHLNRAPQADFGPRLRVLEGGLRYDPTNIALVNRLLSTTRAGGPDADRARASLRKLLAQGETPAIVHFILGVDAWERNRPDEAQVHWQRANELDPRSPSIANNLAVVLATAKSPDLPKALSLVNMALERAPNDPNFRDTRGTILTKMGKWKEALPDLEATLSRQGSKPELHRLLAESYEHLGMAEMAAEHRRFEKSGPEKVLPNAK